MSVCICISISQLMVYIHFAGVELYKTTFEKGMKQTLEMLISIIHLVNEVDPVLNRFDV